MISSPSADPPPPSSCCDDLILSSFGFADYEQGNRLGDYEKYEAAEGGKARAKEDGAKRRWTY